MKQTTHQEEIKTNNLSKVFRTIQRKGPIERKQIQAYTDLSWGAVSQYTAALLQADILTQNLNASGNVGKTPLTLDINQKDNFIVGVDLNFEAIRVMVLDLKGCILKSRVAVVIDPSNVIDLLIHTLESTISEYIGVKNILAISISTQGNIDEEKGVALYLTFVPTWRNLHIKQAVEDHFHIKTFMFHDPDCVLIAEKYFGALNESFRNVILLNMNYALGMSMMIDSKIYSSSNGRCGEVGHITVVPGGEHCSCGRRGCLEAYATKAGIISRFMQAINNGQQTTVDIEDTFNLNYQTIRDYAIRGDSLCLGLFENAGRLLGQTCGLLATIFDSDAIFLYGDLANDKILYQSILEETFQQNLYPGVSTSLIYSNLSASAPALGAAFFALDKILNDFLIQKTELIEQ